MRLRIHACQFIIACQAFALPVCMLGCLVVAQTKSEGRLLAVLSHIFLHFGYVCAADAAKAVNFAEISFRYAVSSICNALSIFRLSALRAQWLMGAHTDGPLNLKFQKFNKFIFVLL